MVMEKFLCWKLKVATVAMVGFAIGTAFFGAIIHILDIAAYADSNFEIQGGFKSYWRSHVWEGWLACNIVMMCCHLLIMAASILILVAIKRFPVFYEFNLLKGYVVLMIMYLIAEFGVVLYMYTWYGPNTFRLPYLVFTFLYWLVTAIVRIIGTYVIYSRILEMDYEIRFGEKRPLSKASSRDLLGSRDFLEMQRRAMGSASHNQSFA